MAQRGREPAAQLRCSPEPHPAFLRVTRYKMGATQPGRWPSPPPIPIAIRLACGSPEVTLQGEGLGRRDEVFTTGGRHLFSMHRPLDTPQTPLPEGAEGPLSVWHLICLLVFQLLRHVASLGTEARIFFFFSLLLEREKHQLVASCTSGGGVGRGSGRGWGKVTHTCACTEAGD